MTNIYDIIRKYNGDESCEPDSVKDDYKEFKDYAYNVKMSIKDINYLLEVLNCFLEVLNDFDSDTSVAWHAKARFWKLLLDSGVHLEVKEKIEKFAGNEFLRERMFARPPFGCTKGRDKSSCELNKSNGCDVCGFNCIEELELSGKPVNANPNFVGFDNI